MVGEEAVDLKMIVGFTATLPSLAPHENVDIRATHYQKAQTTLHSPQSALDSKRDSYHTKPQTPIHPPPCINNNTATQSIFTPKVQLGDFSSYAAHYTKQNTFMFWLGASDTGCQSFAKTYLPESSTNIN